MKPTITAGPASNYEGTEEIIREFQHGGSGGLLSIRRCAPVGLRVDLYRLDDDVKVQAPAEHLLVSDAILLSAQRVMELTSTALSHNQLQELGRRLLANDAFAALLQQLADETLEAERG